VVSGLALEKWLHLNGTSIRITDWIRERQRWRADANDEGTRAHWLRPACIDFFHPSLAPPALLALLPPPPAPVAQVAGPAAVVAAAAAAAAPAAPAAEDTSEPPPPSWWTRGTDDDKMAEVFYLTDPSKAPYPNSYEDRLAFGSIHTKERFPSVTSRQWLQAATYIDSQLIDGGRIRARWLEIKSDPSQIQMDTPRRKRKANPSANDKVWIDEVDQQPFHTDKDGRVLPRTGSASSSDVV
jgi:hypothetical protein